MAFTEAEKAVWHRDKREREKEIPRPRSEPITDCIICNQPFGNGEGHWDTDFPICIVCDDD